MNCVEFRRQIQSCPGNAGKDASLEEYLTHFRSCSPCKEFALFTLEKVTDQLIASQRVHTSLMAKNAHLN